jgi:hypothetical protein
MDTYLIKKGNRKEKGEAGLRQRLIIEGRVTEAFLLLIVNTAEEVGIER